MTSVSIRVSQFSIFYSFSCVVVIPYISALSQDFLSLRFSTVSGQDLVNEKKSMLNFTIFSKTFRESTFSRGSIVGIRPETRGIKLNSVI